MGMCLGKAYTLLGEEDPLKEEKMDRDVSIFIHRFLQNFCSRKATKVSETLVTHNFYQYIMMNPRRM